MQNPKPITLKVNSKNYLIKIDESDKEFALWLSVKLSHNFSLYFNISHKELLKAYVAIVYELYKSEQEIDKILELF